MTWDGKIEAGKSYITRNGCRVDMGFLSKACLNYPWRGDIHRCSGDIEVDRWTPAGGFNNGVSHAYDIVGPWTEPEPQPMTPAELAAMVGKPVVTKDSADPVTLLVTSQCGGTIWLGEDDVDAAGLLRRYTHPDGSPLCSKIGLADDPQPRD